MIQFKTSIISRNEYTLHNHRYALRYFKGLTSFNAFSMSVLRYLTRVPIVWAGNTPFRVQACKVGKETPNNSAVAFRVNNSGVVSVCKVVVKLNTALCISLNTIVLILLSNCSRLIPLSKISFVINLLFESLCKHNVVLIDRYSDTYKRN